MFEEGLGKLYCYFWEFGSFSNFGWRIMIYFIVILSCLKRKFGKICWIGWDFWVGFWDVVRLE